MTINAFPIETTPSHNLSGAQGVANLEAVTSLIFAQKTHASLVHTVADGTGIPNPSGVLTLALAGNGGDELLTPPVNPQPVVGGNYNGYAKLTGFAGEHESGALSVSNGEFVVGVGGAGHYETPHAYIGFSSSASANNVGLIFGIERGGNYYFSQRPTGQRMAATGDVTNVSGGGELDLLEGDKVSVWVCSEKAATITVYDANLGMRMEYQSTL